MVMRYCYEDEIEVVEKSKSGGDAVTQHNA